MPQRNLVIFDLEWNIGYHPHTFNYHGVEQTLRGEIIEIGAAKIDEHGAVLDTFSIHLRPRIFRKLQHHIAKVTGLTQADLDRGEPILQGLRRFMKWCGPDAEFAEWGLDDVPVLKQNLFLCNLDESQPTVWYNLQQIFLSQYPRKEGDGLTLESVVTRLGLPTDRPFHDALADALYTADICRCIDLPRGLAEYPSEEETLRQSLCPAPGDYRDFRIWEGYVEQFAWRSDPKILSAACPAPSARIASCRIISWQKIFCGSCGCAFCSGPSQFREGLCRRKRSCRMFSLSRQTVVSWSAPHNSSASRATPSNPPASMRGVGRSLWTPPRASSSRAVRRSCSSCTRFGISPSPCFQRTRQPSGTLCRQPTAPKNWVLKSPLYMPAAPRPAL